ncbi:MAG: hypothetical protein ACREA0_07185, partial [bacterium]
AYPREYAPGSFVSRTLEELTRRSDAVWLGRAVSKREFEGNFNRVTIEPVRVWKGQPRGVIHVLEDRLPPIPDWFRERHPDLTWFTSVMEPGSRYVLFLTRRSPDLWRPSYDVGASVSEVREGRVYSLLHDRSVIDWNGELFSDIAGSVEAICRVGC